MYVQSSRDGLGFPIVPIIMGASALVGLIKGKPKAPKLTEAQAKSNVQQIYLEIMERDPWNPYDAGVEGYVTCQLEGWCDVDFIRTELLKSAEYHDLQLKKAQQVYGGSPQSSSSSSAFSSSSSSPLASTVGGIPIVYLAGGLVLLLMLKR